MDENTDINFKGLLDTVKTRNSNDKQCKLCECIERELSEVLLKVFEYKKDGELKITLKIKAENGNEINILGSVDKKCPKGQIKQNTFYQDSRGRLYIDDPNQLKIIKNMDDYKNERGSR